MKTSASLNFVNVISLKGFVQLFQMRKKRSLLSVQGLMQAQRNFQRVDIMIQGKIVVGCMTEENLYHLMK